MSTHRQSRLMSRPRAHKSLRRGSYSNLCMECNRLQTSHCGVFLRLGTATAVHSIPCRWAAKPLESKRREKRWLAQTQHPIQSLQGAHKLPVVRQMKVRVTVGCDRAQRGEHCRFVIRWRPEGPGAGPNAGLNRVQQGRYQGGDAHHKRKHEKEVAVSFRAAMHPDDFFM